MTAPASSASVVDLSATPSLSSTQSSHEFSYTGQAQTLIVPEGVTVAEVMVRGASGGGQGDAPGGKGVQVRGQLPVVAGDAITIGVGGKGGDADGNKTRGGGGWSLDGRGGGRGGSAYGAFKDDGSGGGGASAVQVNSIDAVIAGAGGGGGGGTCKGGNGGDKAGSDGTHPSGHTGGRGGSPALPNLDRTGDSAKSSWIVKGGGGGGGGGWHAGEGGDASTCGGGGGGGDSLTSALTSPTVTTAVAGNGHITITFVDTRTWPTMHLTVSPTQITNGQTTTLTVTVPADATGYIGFYDHSIPGDDHGIGVAPIIDGTATLSTPTRPFTTGVHPLSASYGGNTIYRPNDSNETTLTVHP